MRADLNAIGLTEVRPYIHHSKSNSNIQKLKKKKAQKTNNVLPGHYPNISLKHNTVQYAIQNTGKTKIDMENFFILTGHWALFLQTFL